MYKESSSSAELLKLILTCFTNRPFCFRHITASRKYTCNLESSFHLKILDPEKELHHKSDNYIFYLLSM
jgi:hypothetical protein